MRNKHPDICTLHNVLLMQHVHICMYEHVHMRSRTYEHNLFAFMRATGMSKLKLSEAAIYERTDIMLNWKHQCFEFSIKFNEPFTQFR